jgi:hypothetical protein
MNPKKTTLILLVILIIVVAGVEWYVTSPKADETTTQNLPQQNGRIAASSTLEQKPVGKIKADVFSGKLEEVNTGCFADGECYVMVDKKHITVLLGWSRDIVGSVIGVEGFGDLEKYLGKEVEVYAQDKSDGTYTLYGSEGFYIKLK